MYLLIHRRCVNPNIRLNIDRHGLSENAKISRINRLLDPCPSLPLGIWKSPGSSRIQGYFWYLLLDQPTRILTTHSNLSILFPPAYQKSVPFPSNTAAFRNLRILGSPRDFGTNTLRESRNGIRRVHFTCLGFIFTFLYKNAGLWNIHVLAKFSVYYV